LRLDLPGKESSVMEDDKPDDTPKAKVILPKVRKTEGGFRPAGPGGEALKDRDSARDRKPPRQPRRGG
jgi:hypothetical protein